jgi:hypothetical protein
VVPRAIQGGVAGGGWRAQPGGHLGDIDNESHVAAVNGSLGFLLDNGVAPRFCAVMDAGEQLTDLSVAERIASARRSQR